MLTKITLEVHDSWLAPRTSLNNFDQAASFERGFCNIFKCTPVLFLLLCLPKALRYHLTVYKHVCMVGNASISANRRICGFTHIQVCCVHKGLISCYQWKKWWNRIIWRTPVGWDNNSVCIWLPATPKERRSSGSKEPDGSSLPRDSCWGRHQTGTKAEEFGKSPVRRDNRTGGSRKRKRSSANSWAPVRRDDSAVWCAEGKRSTAGGKRQVTKQVSVLFVLKLKSVISVISAF